jgi:hypothetical protein
MSSSLLTDRMFLYTKFLERLSERASAVVWATSARNPRFTSLWEVAPASVVAFPEVRPFKTVPYNYLRWLNELTWDFRLNSTSRLSMYRHVRSKTWRPSQRVLKYPARMIAWLRINGIYEDQLEKILLGFERSEEALQRFLSDPPDLLFATSPFLFDQPAVVAIAKRLGIPTLAFVPSWDNPSMRSRMVFKYDGYIVWSEQTKRDLQHFYPYTRSAPIYVVGAPQFDVFLNPRFHQTRREFAASQGLSADKPIIVHALGSPNLVREHHAALALAAKVSQGALGDVQLLVRPHPIHDNAELGERLRKYYPRVVLQQTCEPGTPLVARSQDESQIVEWINTFRHADVVVNLCSTVAVDAAIFDRPVVNLNYDPEPGQPRQGLVKDSNEKWTHFKPIAQSGGVWLVNNEDEMLAAIKGYLRDSSLHREKRRWIVDYVCGHIDGRCGERMAEAILDFSTRRLRANVPAAL